MTGPQQPKDRAVTVGGIVALLVTALFGIRIVYEISRLAFGG